MTEYDPAFESIQNEHLKTLNNSELDSEKIIICFSGLSGAGKSTISKYLENLYKAVTISSDDIRAIILKLGFADDFNDQHRLSKKYLRWFLLNYNLNNRFIILDSDVSRKYDELYNILSPLGWRFFVIKIEITPETAKQRMIKREKNFTGFLVDIKRRILSYNEFNDKHKADFIMNNEDEISYENLVKEIDLWKAYLG